jgi:hypothetical protein
MTLPDNIAHCAQCNRAFVKVQKSQKLCSQTCKVRYFNERRPHVKIGTVFQCRHCGIEATKRHKRQFYCDACAVLSAKSALPATRRVQLEYQKARNKRRRSALPSVTIHERMSAGIKNSLRDGKGGRSWEALVGFTIADLMRHLERQFQPGMSWGNRGEWHIDHILPLASFNFDTPDDPEFKAAWALTNLRPLWALDNIQKSATRSLLL